MSTPASDRSPDPVTEVRAIPDPAATQLALAIARRLDEKQAKDIVILDVSGPLVIADYFVIATVQSTRQAQSLARDLDAESKALRGRRRRNASGADGEVSNWLLLDFDDVVVHLFQPEARTYYDLEALWADVPRVPFEASGPRDDSEATGNEIRQPTLDGFGAFLPGGDPPEPRE
ncbi:MAG: ribosome silencing factor [Planctomycetes bacterium]|nr:ribosome silencing factor [Planctomycetota bacterium]